MEQHEQSVYRTNQKIRRNSQGTYGLQLKQKTSENHSL